MKIQVIILSFLLVVFGILSCSKSLATINPESKYIDSLKVVNPRAKSININNSKKKIVIEFNENEDLSNVKIQFFLGQGVHIENSNHNTIVFDLRNKNSINLIVQNQVVVFEIQVKIFSIYNQLTPQDSFYLSSHFIERRQLFEKDPLKKYDVVFFGNSITERGNWQILIGDKYLIANRGIGGDNTFGMLSRIQDIVKLSPKKIFIMIGINDIGKGLPVEVIFQNYVKIVRNIKDNNDQIVIYLQSLLPINPNMTDYTKGREKDIRELNNRLKNELAEQQGVEFIDLYSILGDTEGVLEAKYTNDGVHLTDEAYRKWIDTLKNKNYL